MVLSLLLVAALWRAYAAGERAGHLEAVARAAEARADTSARRLEVLVDSLARERAKIERLERDRELATSVARRTTAALSGAVQAAEAAAASQTATVDELREHIAILAAKVRADSVAQADKERKWLAEGLQYQRNDSLSQVAIAAGLEALSDEQASHAVTRALLSCRWFFGKLECPTRKEAFVGGVVVTTITYAAVQFFRPK